MQAAIADANVLAECRDVINDPKVTVVIGTGGSFPAAQMIADILNTTPHNLAVAQRPLELILRKPPAPRVIGVTYSGATSDTVQAIEIFRARGSDVVIVTAGQPDEEVVDPADDRYRVISYGRSRRGSRRGLERGFVSIGATVLPVALWTAAAVDAESVQDVVLDDTLPAKARQFAIGLNELCADRARALAVIGTGWAMGPMIDLESKFTEAGLGFLSLHEAKDFSHGRFTSVVGPRSITGGVLLLGVGPATEYELHLEKMLLDQDTVIYSLRSERPGALGALELLIATQHFSEEYGSKQGVDISKPGSPAADMLSLYRWSRGLAFDED